MTVKELKEKIEYLLQNGHLKEYSKVVVHNELFEISSEIKSIDDYEMGRYDECYLGINIYEKY